MTQQPPQRPNSSLEELKRALESAEAIMVDESGHLMSEEAMQQQAMNEKNGTGPLKGQVTKLKPVRWF